LSFFTKQATVKKSSTALRFSASKGAPHEKSLLGYYTSLNWLASDNHYSLFVSLNIVVETSSLVILRQRRRKT